MKTSLALCLVLLASSASASWWDSKGRFFSISRALDLPLVSDDTPSPLLPKGHPASSRWSGAASPSRRSAPSVLVLWIPTPVMVSGNSTLNCEGGDMAVDDRRAFNAGLNPAGFRAEERQRFFMKTGDEDSWDGSMSGQVSASGEIVVHTPDGSSGKIRVMGSVWLGGRCRHGEGLVEGNLNVSGEDYVFDKDGRATGTVQLRGGLWLQKRVVVNSVSIADNVQLTGTYAPFAP